MKALTFLMLAVVLLMFSPPWARASTPMEKLGLSSQACFFEPGINGIMNVEHSRVLLSNSQQATLMGGQGTCFEVPPGSYSFRIEFLNTQGLFKARSMSPEYKLSLAKGELAVYEVYPVTQGHRYTGGWRARLFEKRAGR